MWKSICNISSAVADLAVIAGKEVAHQFNSASDATESVTVTISKKAAAIRANYEADLRDREAGIKKPVVVTETETPNSIVSVN
jgi:hypothetical protein